MSTHVDGAAPSVADPDDGEPHGGHPGAGAPSALDSGSHWVRAEMQRRMAENRSTRGRHARRAAESVPERAPAPTDAPRRREPPRRTPPASPTPYASAAELPENYIPRHSVQTPGPAAEPAAPISGPIPVIGGPSLPPNGVPARRRRGDGPGTPLRTDGPSATGPWSGPGGTLVPLEQTRRLGAPPEVLGSPGTLPPWGVPPASPPHGLAAVEPPAEVEDDAPVAPVVPAAAVGAGPDVVAVPDVVIWPEAPPPAGAGTAAEVTGPDTSDAPEPADASADAETGPVGSAVTAAPEPGDIWPDRRVDTPTTPHPVVVARGRAAPERLVASQRVPVQAPASTPRPATPRSIPVVGTAPPEPGSTRVRVVLSERKGVARPVRTIKEVQEGTAVGDLLRRDLIRSQLLVTLRFAALTVLVLGALPAVFVLLPEVARFHVLGVRVPWLLLGVLMYPFLVGVAWRYTRIADRVEQNFADHVQD